MLHRARDTTTDSPPRHPGVQKYLERRSGDVQSRLADAITAFTGSMPFVYVHVVAFAGWMILVEGEPWPRLTLAVSLEAIFLSTFVMIGQNRQAAIQQAKADHDFVAQELELKSNTDLTREIHRLIVDAMADREPDGTGLRPSSQPGVRGQPDGAS
jgi:uncharacterized membrane protein